MQVTERGFQSGCRSRGGPRRRVAAVALRGLAILLLAAAGGSVAAIGHARPGPAAPAATLGDFALASLAFGALVAGIALLIEGPGLFRRVPYPRRRLF